MLDRTSLPSPLAQPQLGVLRPRPLLGESTAPLFFLLSLVAICALTCAYVWVASTIAEIERDTRATRQELVRLEEENVSLMVQLAQWNRPAYIAEKAAELGLTPGGAAWRVEVTPPRPFSAELPLEPQLSHWQRWAQALANISSLEIVIEWPGITTARSP